MRYKILWLEVEKYHFILNIGPHGTCFNMFQAQYSPKPLEILGVKNHIRVLKVQVVGTLLKLVGGCSHDGGTLH